MRIGFVLVVALLLLPACGDDDDVDAAAPTTAAASSTLHVEADGLLAGGVALRFGSTRDDVIEALGAPAEEGEQAECPAGPATTARYDDLLLTLQDGELVGWSIGGESPLTTPDGVGIGTTRAELELALGPAQVVPDSTLGTELFYDGGLSALLESDDDDAAVTALWAGTTCIFR